MTDGKMEVTKGVFEDMIFNAICHGRPLPPLTNKHVKKALWSLQLQGLIANRGTKKKPNWQPTVQIADYESGVVPDETDEEN